MRKTVLLTGFLVFGLSVSAQDLPENPEPGKCYVRCKTPDVWKNENVRIETKAAYNRIVTHPAVFKTVTERVMTKEPSTRLEIVPAKYETRKETIIVKEASYRLEIVPGSFNTENVVYTSHEGASSLEVVPASFREDFTTVEVKPATAVWKMSEVIPDCESGNPDDCRYWCYTPIPAQFETVSQTHLAKDAYTVRKQLPEKESQFRKTVVGKKPTTRQVEIPAVTKVIEKTVMVSPPSTRTIEIPAEYATIQKVILEKDAWEEVENVPAEYKTISKEVLLKKGGLTTWKEVDCKLVEYNPLPINWNLGSATLTSKAKSIIDTRLLPILKDGVTIELASHTDSRSSHAFNQDLSERRAQAVANYLISKGVNPSQLVAIGYGETRLINRCADGVSCTEREHQANRRTEFRVINR